VCALYDFYNGLVVWVSISQHVLQGTLWFNEGQQGFHG